MIFFNLKLKKSYQTVSKVKIIDQKPAHFPTLTLCDSNPFTTKYSYAMLSSLFVIINSISKNAESPTIYLSELGFYQYYLDSTNKISFNLFTAATGNMMAPSFNYSSRKALGWDLTQVLNKCTFNGVKCDFENDFQWYFSPQYGNCYHFNPSPTGNQVNCLFLFMKNSKWLCVWYQGLGCGVG